MVSTSCMSRRMSQRIWIFNSCSETFFWLTEASLPSRSCAYRDESWRFPANQEDARRISQAAAAWKGTLGDGRPPRASRRRTLFSRGSAPPRVVARCCANERGSYSRASHCAVLRKRIEVHRLPCKLFARKVRRISERVAERIGPARFLLPAPTIFPLAWHQNGCILLLASSQLNRERGEFHRIYAVF